MAVDESETPAKKNYAQSGQINQCKVEQVILYILFPASERVHKSVFVMDKRI